MACRAIGECPWWAFTHCIASEGRMICGLAWLNSIGSGSMTSISLAARPVSMAGSSAMRARPRLHPDTPAALAGVVELEEILLGGGLLGNGGGRGRGPVVVPSPALQELERHGTSMGVARAYVSST